MTTATTHWQDWASFALGIWLAVSPWLAGYVENEAATANAAVAGLALALTAHCEVSFDEVAAEWLNLALGAWLLAAPFVLGFTSQSVAAVNCVAVGAFVAVLAGSALELDKEISSWWHKRPAGH